MPTAGKIFRYRENLSLEEIHKKLEGHRTSISSEESGIALIADITGLRLSEDELEGLYRFDSLVIQYHRSGMQIYPKTTDAAFVFKEKESGVFIVIIAKKVVANNVANELSRILHGETGAITEVMIDPKAVEHFYESGEGTKVLFLDELPIPNMKKLAMYGANVLQTNLFGEYKDEGEPWYVVVKTKTGYTAGLVRDASVTVFNMVDMPAFLSFLEDNIFPLILRRAW